MYALYVLDISLRVWAPIEIYWACKCDHSFLCASAQITLYRNSSQLCKYSCFLNWQLILKRGIPCFSSAKAGLNWFLWREEERFVYKFVLFLKLKKKCSSERDLNLFGREWSACKNYIWMLCMQHEMLSIFIWRQIERSFEYKDRRSVVATQHTLCECTWHLHVIRISNTSAVQPMAQPLQAGFIRLRQLFRSSDAS